MSSQRRPWKKEIAEINKGTSMVGAAGLEPATLCLEGGMRHDAEVPCFPLLEFNCANVVEAC